MRQELAACRGRPEVNVSLSAKLLAYEGAKILTAKNAAVGAILII